MKQEWKKSDANRWQMHRVGLMGFWYYENDEFVLEDGRLILRGANSSGKSVTMQSFLPLVLDGDKRPHRLDPFGTKDRRIEYYLLGEENSGHTDRTGYLWIEFYHFKKNVYKTIGIGLHARRGIPQIEFWGFLLLDGRRVNKDFRLYDENHYLEHGQRIPLQYSTLEKKIGSGGRVVREQTAYMAMVNKELFGFNEQESYQALLRLLLQLRKPKLSKDLKPSEIYEVLMQALPPLTEEELNPLSDILENMDQISDRLEELEKHRQELERFQKVYDQYNRYQLNLCSTKVLQCSINYNQCVRQIEQEKFAETTLKVELFTAEQKLKEKTNRFDEANEELKALELSQESKEQKELEQSENQLADVVKFVQDALKNYNDRKKRFEQLEKDVFDSNKKLDTLQQEQNMIMDELESMAREIEFAEHHIYHCTWMQGDVADIEWRDAWRRDLDAHKKVMESALEVSIKEKQARETAGEAETQLGDIRKERDQVEREYAEQEKKIELQRDSLKEALVQWQQGLKYLPFNGENIREAFQALSLMEIKKRDYKIVKRCADIAYENKKQEHVHRHIELAQQKKQVEEEYIRFSKEQEEWLAGREPAPTRSEGRIRSRSHRNSGKGAPLYAVCEFRTSLKVEVQAKLEAILESAGLLDAWIFPGGRIGVWIEDEEEVWIEPQAQIHASTLAEVLLPAPSTESGLSQDDIGKALSSFGWEEKEEIFLDEKSGNAPWIYANGSFRLGPLAGKTASKLCAEFIGKETRNRTKELLIAQLDMSMEVCVERVKEIERSLENLYAEERLLDTEMHLFPKDEGLQKAFDDLVEIIPKLDSAVDKEKLFQGLFKEKMSIWRALQIELLRLTTNWSLLKSEKDLRKAIELCSEYDREISDLYSTRIRQQDELKSKEKMQAEMNGISISMEDALATKEEYEGRKRLLKVKVERLKRIIDEMGLKDLHSQILQLKSEQGLLKGDIVKFREKKESAIGRISEVKARTEIHQAALQGNKAALDSTIHSWQFEMKLALVTEWREKFHQGMDEGAIYELCEEIVKKSTGQFDNQSKEENTNILLKEFNLVVASLTDYVLESCVDENRITILSMRDRVNPQPPWKLLEELVGLENEQRSLLSQKDRELYEEIILSSVGKAIRKRIQWAYDWMGKMDQLMKQRNTSNGLRFSLAWDPKARQTEQQMDTEKLVDLLLREAHLLDDNELENMIAYFRSGIAWAKREAREDQEPLRKYIYDLLDYRSWFQFRLSYRKGGQTGYRELTDAGFNKMSGGEKAMAMYIPLFAAVCSRYSDANPEAPQIVCLDEAFAGVDEKNMRDMFGLLTEMGFDYMMTSQILWGCYDTVPSLAIYHIDRPDDIDFITLTHYRWNGRRKEMVEEQYEIEERSE